MTRRKRVVLVLEFASFGVGFAMLGLGGIIGFSLYIGVAAGFGVGFGAGLGVSLLLEDVIQ
jgi:hypothetical protein